MQQSLLLDGRSLSLEQVDAVARGGEDRVLGPDLARLVELVREGSLAKIAIGEEAR